MTLMNEEEKKARKRFEEKRMAMQAVYSELVYLDMGEEIDVKAAVEAATGKSYDVSPLFVKETAIYALKYLTPAIEKFQSHMRNWKWERLNRVEQAILLAAYVHFFHVEEGVHKAVPISVAVDLAKEYLDEKDYRFVNGILDNVLTRE